MLKPISSHVAVLAAGLGLGAAGIAIASPSNPQAHSAASDSRIVRELQTMNKKLDVVNKNLGGYDSIPSKSSGIAGILRGICRNTSNIEGAYERCY